MSKLVTIFFAGLVTINTFYERESISYFQTPTLDLKDTSGIYVHPINDSVFQVRKPDHSPLYYHTFLNTGVCFDNQCRPLSIKIFWNITGRYLGFELSRKEFLSKYDHEPFSDKEYQQLDSLLANPFLPLGDYSFYDLVESSSPTEPDVDGVSGATNRDVIEYIVEGAAYTTHKLWNIIHGPIAKQVVAATENQLNPDLYVRILESQVSSDRTWIADRTGLLGSLSDELVDDIAAFLDTAEYSESYFLIKSISPEQLQSDYLEDRLFNQFGKADYAVGDLILDKLEESNALSSSVVDRAISNLNSYSDMQLVKVLKLLKHHKIQSPEFTKKLASVATDKNPYIKSQISKFLETP